jgi:DNA-binding response OmpR family regulator
MAGLKKKTVVFVCDDESLDLSIVRRILESTGRFEVLTCSDYTGGVHLFDANDRRIEVALLDVALPGKNGVELARYILNVNPNVKVLFVSGHVGSSVLQLYGINAADEHFLQKPFDSATLLRRVQEALTSNRPLEFVQSASGRTVES